MPDIQGLERRLVMLLAWTRFQNTALQTSLPYCYNLLIHPPSTPGHADERRSEKVNLLSDRISFQQLHTMADVLVDNAANQVLPHRKQIPSSIPNIDSLEGLGTDGSDEYSTLKKLQRHLEYVSSQYRHIHD